MTEMHADTRKHKHDDVDDVVADVFPVPPEISLAIASLLDATSLARLARTSRAGRTLAAWIYASMDAFAMPTYKALFNPWLRGIEAKHTAKVRVAPATADDVPLEYYISSDEPRVGQPGTPLVMNLNANRSAEDEAHAFTGEPTASRIAAFVGKAIPASCVGRKVTMVWTAFVSRTFDSQCDVKEVETFVRTVYYALCVGGREKTPHGHEPDVTLSFRRVYDYDDENDDDPSFVRRPVQCTTLTNVRRSRKLGDVMSINFFGHWPLHPDLFVGAVRRDRWKRQITNVQSGSTKESDTLRDWLDTTMSRIHHDDDRGSKWWFTAAMPCMESELVA